MFDYNLVTEMILPEISKGTEVSADGIFERPKVFETAFERALKYTCFKGGRGSGKTFAAISKLIEESFLKEFRKCVFLVMRELIGNLEDIENTIIDVIDQAGLSDAFTYKRHEITNKLTKCSFKFRGARSSQGKTQMSQINKLKGLHKVRRVLIDEAQDMSEETLNVLLPTVNRSGQIKVRGKELEETPDVKWIFCMNPNLKRDPVIETIESQGEEFIDYQVLHVNIFDIEPKFQDKQLLQMAKAAEGQFYYRHVWLGEEFYRISGYPFAWLESIRTNEQFKTVAFLDPSFAGGDFTALSFAALKDGKLYLWGYCWRESWTRVKHEIIELLREHNCIDFQYESNGLAEAPEEAFAELGVTAEPKYSLGNKHNRIYMGAAFIEQKAYLVQNKSNSEYVKNVLEYSDEAKNDDAPDSLVSNLIHHDLIPEYKKVGVKWAA